MLTPEELRDAPQSLVLLYRDLEDFIIADVVRRIRKTGLFSPTAADQSAKALAMGMDMSEIREQMKRFLFAADDQIDELFGDALTASVGRDNAIYESAGKGTLPVSSPLLQTILAEAKAQTKGDFRNFTRSMGFANATGGWESIAQTYQTELNLAALKMRSGVTNRDTAMREAVRRLTREGLSYVDYKTGHRNRLDVAVDRAIRTGVNQMVSQSTLAMMDELGAEYVETTAHAGARDTHVPWQGKVFKKSEGTSWSGAEDREDGGTLAETGSARSTSMASEASKYGFLGYVGSLEEDFEGIAELSLSPEDVKFLKQVYDLGRADGKEHGIAYIDGKAYPFTSRKENAITIPPDILSMLDGNGAKDIKLYHNHPNGTAPSAKDLELLLRSRVGAIYVVGGNGNIHAVSVGDGIVPTLNEMREFVKKTGQEIYSELLPEGATGRIKEQEFNHLFAKEQAYRIARKYEWSYEGGKADEVF